MLHWRKRGNLPRGSFITINSKGPCRSSNMDLVQWAETGSTSVGNPQVHNEPCPLLVAGFFFHNERGTMSHAAILCDMRITRPAFDTLQSEGGTEYEAMLSGGRSSFNVLNQKNFTPCQLNFHSVYKSPANPPLGNSLC